jgi:hypothetical protein
MIVEVDWKKSLREWTQNLYLTCLANSSVPQQIKLSELRDCVRKSLDFSSSPSSPPSLRTHAGKQSAKLTLGNHDYQSARLRLEPMLASILLLDLDILVSSTLERMAHSKADTLGMLNKIGANLSDLHWAKFRVVELSVVRNIVTHSHRVWSEEAVRRLEQLDDAHYPLPKVGQEVRPRLAHVFAYKTAARNVLSRCEQHLECESMPQEIL